MSERFYINWPLSPGPATLDGPEAHHLAAVCRLRPGDQVTLFNGDGHEYPARLIHISPRGQRQIDLEITERLTPPRELAYPVELAAPIPKGDRGQFLIEKLTELGVTTFVPLTCQHSVSHPRETRREKLDRYVIEASKQCGRNVLMAVKEPIAWAAYCMQAARPGALSILAHPEKMAEVGRVAGESGGRGLEFRGGYRLAVGPEGGFTPEEVAMARAAGWHSVDLGRRILRIETAALVLAAWFVAEITFFDVNAGG